MYLWQKTNKQIKYTEKATGDGDNNMTVCTDGKNNMNTWQQRMIECDTMTSYCLRNSV